LRSGIITVQVAGQLVAMVFYWRSLGWWSLREADDQYFKVHYSIALLLMLWFIIELVIDLKKNRKAHQLIDIIDLKKGGIESCEREGEIVHPTRTINISVNSSLSASSPSSEEVVDVGRELVNLGVVVLLQTTQHAHLLGRYEVDGNSLLSIATAATDAMKVVLHVSRDLEVDHQRDVNRINASCIKVGGDQHASVALSKVFKGLRSLFLRESRVGKRHCKVVSVEVFRKVLRTTLGVHEDDCLGDVQRPV